MSRPLAIVALVLALVLAIPSSARAAYSWERTAGPEGAIVLAFVTTPLGTILVGTDSGGLYRSVDGGDTWEPVTLSWPCCNYTLPSLAVSDTSVYAGTWGGGVHRSDDDGVTWYPTGSIPDEGYPIILGLAACRYGERVYAGGQFGVARSDDGGANWTLMSDGLPASWVRTLALRGTDLYARLDQDIYRFDEEGGTWVEWEEGLASTAGMQSIGVTADALFLSTHEGGVYHLDCNDSVWVAMNDGLWDDNVDATVEVDQRLYAGLMGGGVWRWDPASYYWGEVNAGLWNKDVRSMGRQGLSALAGTWGAGVFRLDPATDEWSVQAAGMTAPPVAALVTDGDDVYAGSEGGGVYYSADQGDTWVQSIDGLENYWVWSMARDASGVYAGTWNGVFKSTDQGGSWSASGLQGDGVFALIAAGSTLYAGTYGGHVWSSENGGGSWTEIGTGLPSANVVCLERVGSTLCAASWEHGVYALPDGETTWASINDGLPELLMQSMISHDGILFLGTDSKGVYKWDDVSATWDSCGPANTVMFSLASVGGDLLAGSWGALWATADTGRTWTDVHPGLGDWYAIRELAAGSENLFAGLWGGGVWRAPLAISAVDEGTGAESETSLRVLRVDPNPFASGARIAFRLDRPEPIDLAVYDPSGRRVASIADGVLPAGPHEKSWDGRNASGERAAAGVYFIRLETGGKTLTTKTVHLR